MEKIVLGISLGFNSSACVLGSSSGVLSAISEERLTNEKNTKRIPFKAIRECLSIAGVNAIDSIAICHYENITKDYFQKYSGGFNLLGNTWEEYILNFLDWFGVEVKDKKILRVDHHTAHGYATLGIYGVSDRKGYLITADGFGDGVSERVRKLDGKFNEIVAELPLKSSVGLVYQFVTGALGFKEHQHEGKITGLAAYGEPKYLYELFNIDSESVWLTFEEMEQVKKSQIIDFDKFLRLKKAVYRLVERLLFEGATREDIAASVQEYAERRMKGFIGMCCAEGGNAYLSGGLFANVKINQRIKELGLFNNVYVCPPMGDEGTCIGAAVAAIGIYNYKPSKSAYANVLSGTDIDGDEDTYDDVCNEINRRCLQDKYRVTFFRNGVEDFIPKALAKNKIVCLMRDKMEFGPRALCHRSILYNATEKETNDSLNKRLSRSEFMPFAPVCREEVADELFKNLDGGRDSAKFMTMTFDGTDEFIQTYKAVAHIDGTARPQLVSKNDDAFMWNVLKRYEELTGLKCLVNTSFNLHEYPIVESEGIALDSFIKADLDVLVIGNVVIEKLGE